MNEIHWLSGEDVMAMLAHVEPDLTPRQLRLYACGVVRCHWHRLDWYRRHRAFDDIDEDAPQGTPLIRQAVEAAERLAEGPVAETTLADMREQAQYSVYAAPEFDRLVFQGAAATLAEDAAEAARTATDSLVNQVIRDALEEEAFGRDDVRVAQAARVQASRQFGRVLREIVGNPFRPIGFDQVWARWSDGVVVGMARQIREAQNFAELPYLADALMDAGCAEDALLRHLREPPADHRRGCWALDLLCHDGGGR